MNILVNIVIATHFIASFCAILGVSVIAANCQFIVAQWQEDSLVQRTGKPITNADNLVKFTFFDFDTPQIARMDVFANTAIYQDALCPVGSQVSCMRPFVPPPLPTPAAAPPSPSPTPEGTTGSSSYTTANFMVGVVASFASGLAVAALVVFFRMGHAGRRSVVGVLGKGRGRSRGHSTQDGFTYLKSSTYSSSSYIDADIDRPHTGMHSEVEVGSMTMYEQENGRGDLQGQEEEEEGRDRTCVPCPSLKA